METLTDPSNVTGISPLKRSFQGRTLPQASPMQRDRQHQKEFSSIKIISTQAIEDIASVEMHIPFLQHHHQPLNQKALYDLRCKTFVQPQNAFIANDIYQSLSEPCERLPFPANRRLRLQHGLGDDKWVGGNGCQNFGESTKHWSRESESQYITSVGVNENVQNASRDPSSFLTVTSPPLSHW